MPETEWSALESSEAESESQIIEAVIADPTETEETETESETESESERLLIAEIVTETAIEAIVLPEAADIVKVTDYLPNVCVDLKYATKDNFTGQVIYDFSDAYLRYGTICKLQEVQKELEEQGMTLVIWDAYRPVSAQFTLWEVCPNSTYVANPYKGYSSHSRGNTVDITIGYPDGSLMKMPTGFDDFSTKADRDYSECNKEERNNARYLEALMENAGFQPYYGEWWHFSDTTKYGVPETDLIP